jgi:hypothetical protein
MSSSPSQDSDGGRGPLYILLFVVGFLLGVFASKTTRRNGEPVTPQNSIANPRDGSRSLPSPIMKPTDSVPQNNRSQWRDENTPLRKKFYEWAVSLGTLGLLLINIGLWYSTKKSVDVAQRALVLTNRPWIKIKHRVIKPLDFNFVGAAGPAAVMTFEHTIENVGNGVALDVISWEDVIPVDPDFSTTTARKRRDAWCNNSKKFDGNSKTTLNGYVLFPKDPLVEESGGGPLMSDVAKAVENNKPFMERFYKGSGPNTLLGKVAFVMVGCVAYRSSLDEEGTRPDITGFMYRLGELSDGLYSPFVEPKGVADKLQLINLPDGSFAE